MRLKLLLLAGLVCLSKIYAQQPEYIFCRFADQSLDSCFEDTVHGKVLPNVEVVETDSGFPNSWVNYLRRLDFHYVVHQVVGNSGQQISYKVKTIKLREGATKACVYFEYGMNVQGASLYIVGGTDPIDNTQINEARLQDTVKRKEMLIQSGAVARCWYEVNSCFAVTGGSEFHFAIQIVLGGESGVEQSGFAVFDSILVNQDYKFIADECSVDIGSQYRRNMEYECLSDACDNQSQLNGDLAAFVRDSQCADQSACQDIWRDWQNETCNCPGGFRTQSRTHVDGTVRRYRDNLDLTCKCTDTCEKCHANADCNDSGAAIVCTCKAGYTGDGIDRCDPINPCDDDNGGCDENADCTFPGVGQDRICKCKAGYTGDGRKCEKIKRCADDNGGCDGNATCTDLADGTSCACNEGYSGDGKICTDIDQCETNNGGCHENADCKDQPGTKPPICTCKHGFSGNGTSCKQSCDDNNGGCDVNAHCNDTGDEIVCTCKDGYAGDGKNCTGPIWTNFTVRQECNGSCIEPGMRMEQRTCLLPVCTTEKMKEVGKDYVEVKAVKCVFDDYDCQALGPWSNFTECTEKVVCEGDGKKRRYRECEEEFCYDDEVDSPVKLYMRGERKTDVQDCNLMCAYLETVEETDCSVSCGRPGFRNATYECKGDIGTCEYGGKECEPGDKIHVINEMCNLNVSCPVIWSDWSEWSDCNITCGGVGESTRNRTCLNETCHSEREESRNRTFNKGEYEVAKQDCDRSHIECGNNFNEWEKWTECSGTCGVGMRHRSRTCKEGKECLGQCDQKEKCFTECRKTTCPSYPPFPGECNFEDDCISDFSSYNKENKRTFFRGIPNSEIRPTYEPTFMKEGCGNFMRLYRDDDVKINFLWSKVLMAAEKYQCIGFDVAVISNDYNEITDMQVYIYYLKRPNNELIYSKFASTNSTWEQVRRAVQVDVNEPYVVLFTFSETILGVSYGDVGIDEFKVESGNCITRGWTEWTKWECSVTCGTGRETRRRTCLSSGNCDGESQDERDCVLPECPVKENGGWGRWSKFSVCSETCGSGVRTRTRKCDSPSPKYGGNACPLGDTNTFGIPVRSMEETDCIPCNVRTCTNFFTHWTPWTECSGTCGGGTRMRSRTCEEGKMCTGPYQQIEKCNDGCRNRECPNYHAMIDCNFDVPAANFPEKCRFNEYATDGIDGSQPFLNPWIVVPAMSGRPSGPSGDATFPDGCGKFFRFFSDDEIKVSYFWTGKLERAMDDEYCLKFKYSMVSTQNSSMGNFSVYKHYLTKPRAAQPVLMHDGVTEKEWESAELSIFTHTDEPFVIVFKIVSGGSAYSDVGIDDLKLMDLPCSENYTRWSDYGACDMTCGDGNKTRSRVCIDEESIACDYNQIYYDSAPCNAGACPPDPELVNGNWSDWTVKVACNATCEERNGIKIEERDCDDPSPANGGLLCLLTLGEAEELEFPLRGDHEERCVPCTKPERECVFDGFTSWSLVAGSNNDCAMNCSTTVEMERTCFNGSSPCTSDLDGEIIATNQTEKKSRECTLSDPGNCVPDGYALDSSPADCNRACLSCQGVCKVNYTYTCDAGGGCQPIELNADMSWYPPAEVGETYSTPDELQCSDQLLCQSGLLAAPEIVNFTECTVNCLQSERVHLSEECQNGSCYIGNTRYLPGEKRFTTRACGPAEYCPNGGIIANGGVWLSEAVEISNCTKPACDNEQRFLTETFSCSPGNICDGTGMTLVFGDFFSIKRPCRYANTADCAL